MKIDIIERDLPGPPAGYDEPKGANPIGKKCRETILEGPTLLEHHFQG
jgi:hypothetical protein